MKEVVDAQRAKMARAVFRSGAQATPQEKHLRAMMIATARALHFGGAKEISPPIFFLLPSPVSTTSDLILLRCYRPLGSTRHVMSVAKKY